MGNCDRKITKIVITGGPCAGKTTAMNKVKEYFEKEGFNVVIVPETATELICSGIAPWTMDSKTNYQMYQMKLQFEKERIYSEAAEHLQKDGKLLVVLDRGAMDNKAYLTDDQFDSILSVLELTEEDILGRYSAVFHLVSAAKGDGKAYSLANNTARTESADEASGIDDRLLLVWKNHPYRKIIDNNINFETKLENLIVAIREYLKNE